MFCFLHHAPPPTLRRRGEASCFANVGWSVRPPVDKKVPDHYLENDLSQSFHISNAD